MSNSTTIRDLLDVPLMAPGINQIMGKVQHLPRICQKSYIPNN